MHYQNRPAAPLCSVIEFKDEKIFDYLYKIYWHRLVSFAQGYIDDHEICKEVVQDLFISLHVKRAQLQVRVSLNAYLYSSLRNQILNRLRKESVYKKRLERAGEWFSQLTGHDTAMSMELLELERALGRCLEKMPAPYREVYILNQQHAYSLKRTAEILERPVDVVRRQRQKAFCFLQQQLVRHR